MIASERPLDPDFSRQVLERFTVNVRHRIEILLVASFVTAAAQADTLLVMNENWSMAGEDGATTIVTFWSRADRMARVDDSGRIVSDLERGVTYFLDDEDETCQAFAGQDAGGAGAAAAELGIRETGETRRIGAWQAKGYALNVAMGDEEAAIAVWVSDEVDVNTGGQRAYIESVATADTAWMLALFDLGGYPVRHEIDMGPIRSWSELVSVEEKAAPAGIYDIPSGYSGCE